MEVKILIRQPKKLILCTLFLGCLAIASLFFGLQFAIDLISSEYIAKAYTCTGSVIPAKGLNALSRHERALRPMEQDAITLLESAPTVDYVDKQHTLSGHVAGARNVGEGLMFRNHAGRLVVMDITVPDESKWERLPLGYGTDEYAVRFQLSRDFRVVAAHPGWTTRVYQPFIKIVPERDGTSIIEAGKRYLMLGSVEKMDFTGWGYQTDAEVNVGMLLTAADIARSGEKYPRDYPPICTAYLNNIYNAGHAVIPLANDAKPADVTAALEAHGMLPYVEQISLLSEVYTVRTVGSTEMTPAFKNGELLITNGRGLRTSDIGKKVCVVNYLAANESGWAVGDKIPLALANGSYSLNGNLSGYPMLGEVLSHPFDEAAEYEIVGFFKHRDYDTWMDSFSPSINTLFIPHQEGYAPEAPVYPYAFGFQVLGRDIAAFRADTEPQLRRMGYETQMNYSGWASVEDIYGDISDRRAETLAAALVTLLAGCMLYALLLGKLYRREYALRKLLGTPFGKAWRAYATPLAVSAAVAGVLSVSVVTELYLKLLRPEMAAVMAEALPPAPQVVALLAIIFAAQILLCTLLLLLMARRAEHTAVRVLVK